MIDKIRAEIDTRFKEARIENTRFYYDVLEIIDKYAEQEPCDDNRLYIKVYADLEPQEKAEKLYQICEEEELLEVYKELGEYCEIEPCDDVVSREAVKELIKSGISTDTYEDIELVCKWVDEMPPVRPQEQTGHWIMSDDGLYRPICDKCGAHPWKGYIPTVEEATDVFKYCPNCGARMVEPQESERP